MSVNASTIVVINGPAIIVGSNFSFLATKGRIPPTIFANITVAATVMETVKETAKPTLSSGYYL